MKDKLLSLTIALLLFTVFQSNAQFTKWSVSGGFGLAGYSGDLNTSNLSELEPALNIEVWYQIHNNFQLKAGTSLYQLSGKDHISQRNRGFVSNNYELYVAAMGLIPVNRFDFFTYIGAGITKVDPEGIGPGGLWDLPEYDIEGGEMDKTAFIIPAGVGVRYKVTPSLAVVLDAGIRIADTDYLDGVSRRNIPVNELSNAAIGYFNSIGNNRANLNNDNPIFLGGNPDTNDYYGIFSLKLQYIIPSKGMNLYNALPRLR